MGRLLHQSVRWAAGSAGFEQCVSVIERCAPDAPNLLRVLMYHRVDFTWANRARSPKVLSATPAGFARQMEFLQENYRVVSVYEVLAAIRRQRPLPRRAVLITFDDAYDDFAIHAWPVLQKLQLPAVMFVATAFPDTARSYWWDDLHAAIFACPPGNKLLADGRRWPLDSDRQRAAAYAFLVDHLALRPHADVLLAVQRICRELGYQPPHTPSVLSWEQLGALRRAGLTLAPHTRTHARLTQITARDAQDEILGSWTDLQERFGDIPAVFAYPQGDYARSTLELLRKAGFQLAFTTRRGINDLTRSDPLQLRRIHVGCRSPHGVWRAQLLAPMRWANPLWRSS